MARSDRLVVRATLRLWDHRTRRAPSDIAYLVYLSVLIGAIVLVPIFRTAWLLLSQPLALAVLTASSFSTYALAIVLVLIAGVCAPWAAPVVRRAFLARVLSDSDVHYSVAFGGPAVRWWVLVAALGAAVAALIQGVLWNAGLSDAVTFACVVVSAIAVAACTAFGAIMAQTGARTGAIMSLSALALALVTIVVTPPTAIFGQPTGAFALAVLAASSLAAAPSLMNRFHPQTIVAASLRRDAAIVGLALMDAGVVADAINDEPRSGRHRSAVPRTPLWLSFAVGSAVGAARTPGRVARGTAVMVGGMALAAALPWGWGVAVGALLAYVGLGAFSTGIEQAARAARTTPVYGVTDAALIAMNVIFPATMMALASTVGLVNGLTGIAVALAAGTGALFARVFAALTPPTPLELLMPVPTPAGDAAALLRLAWALQGAIAAVAFAVLVLPGVLGLDVWRLLWVPGVAAILLTTRWRTRS